MANINKTQRKSQMFSLVDQWQNSNETKKSFCTRNQINIHTFNYWVKKYKDSNTFSDFIEFKPSSASIPKSNTLTIKFSFAGNVEAEVPADIALNFMHQLVQR